MFVINLKLHI